MKVRPSPRTAILMLVAAGVCGWRFSLQYRAGIHGSTLVALILTIVLASVGSWLLWKRFRD